MRKLIGTLGLAGLLGLASAVPAQDMNAEQAARVVHVRQSVMTVVGWSIAPMGAMVRGLVPWDQGLFAERARRIAWMSTMVSDAFRPDTRAFDVKTEALPAIWDESDTFAEHAADLLKSSERLAEVAATGDEAATREAFSSMVDDCKGCHDQFREDRD